MRRQHRTLAACACCALMASGWMHGQASVNDALRERSQRKAAVAEAVAGPAPLPVTIEDALQEMFATAAIVFTGEVRAVERGRDVVIIRFDVEDGIRGLSSGGTFSMREWSGLWIDNGTRYAVGQHLLLLLHAPSVAGFASPLRDGVIALSGDATTGAADLRWVALHVAASTPDGGDAGLVLKSSAVAEVVPVADDANGHVDRAVVMDLLHAWQQAAERAQ